MITNEDLLKEISLQELTELSDLNATGDINQEVIDDALNDAISFIESFIVLPNKPSALLKKITVDFTLYELRKRNKLINDEDKEQRKQNESYLHKMSIGRLKTQLDVQEFKKENQSFAFRHRPRRRVRLDGFR